MLAPESYVQSVTPALVVNAFGTPDAESLTSVDASMISAADNAGLAWLGCVPRRDGICEVRDGRPGVFGRLAQGIEHLENRIVDQDRQDLRQLNRLDNRLDRDFFGSKK